jgi:hypothetical protein
MLGVSLIQRSVQIHKFDDGDLGLFLVGKLDGIDHIWQEEAGETESLLVPNIWSVGENTPLQIVSLSNISDKFNFVNTVFNSESVINC